MYTWIKIQHVTEIFHQDASRTQKGKTWKACVHARMSYVCVLLGLSPESKFLRQILYHWTTQFLILFYHPWTIQGISNLVLPVLLQIWFFDSFLSEILSRDFQVLLSMLLESRHIIAAHSGIWILSVSRDLTFLSLPLLCSNPND